MNASSLSGLCARVMVRAMSPGVYPSRRARVQTLFVGLRSRHPERDLDVLAVSRHREGQLRVGAEQRAELGPAAHPAAFDAREHVARLEPRLGGGAAGLDRAHPHAGLLREAQVQRLERPLALLDLRRIAQEDLE